jgi:hypothetical protein
MTIGDCVVCRLDPVTVAQQRRVLQADAAEEGLHVIRSWLPHVQLASACRMCDGHIEHTSSLLHSL